MPTTIAFPPGPGPELPFTSLFRMGRDPLAFFTGLQRRYGDFVHFRGGAKHLFLLSNPEDIRTALVTHARHLHKDRGLRAARQVLGDGLLTSEGDFHKRQRRLAQPAFHHHRIAGYAGVMAEFAARQVGTWRDGQELDVDREMMQLTLAIVAKTLFDSDTEQEAREIGHSLDEVVGLFELKHIPFAPILDRLPFLPSTRRLRKARARLNETVYRFIREHQASGEDRGDLLSMLLSAQDTEGDGGRMNDQQLRDEAMTIFLAGHETTANALSWTLYLLAQHPEIEARVHAEVDGLLEGRAPGLEDVKRLEFTERVLAESMRLYPPGWILGRETTAELEIGGWKIPTGSTLLLSPWVVHRHPGLYPDPERFDPERFTPENKAARPKFAFFPFGGGPRTCIGEGFAWMEGVLVLATIAQRFRLRLSPGQVVVPQPRITLRLEGGLRMRVEARTREARREAV